MEDSLEESLTTHSSNLAWRIPWTEEPGRLPSLVSQRVGHDRGNLACMHAYMLIFPCSVRGEGLKVDMPVAISSSSMEILVPNASIKERRTPWIKG